MYSDLLYARYARQHNCWYVGGPKLNIMPRGPWFEFQLQSLQNINICYKASFQIVII